MANTRLLILYGSQTGNAQDVAERVAREARLMLFTPAVMPMDAYPLQHLPEERLVVLVAATTGQGDPPNNMKKLWKQLLRKSLPPTLLSSMQYAVFGLGDSGYVKYNVAAKKLDRRLAALGATPVIERGLGDDQHPCGYEASLDPWLQQLWPALRQHCHLPAGVIQPVLSGTALLQLGRPKYKVTFMSAPQQQTNIMKQQQHQQQLQQLQAQGLSSSDLAQLQEQHLIEQAVTAAAAFRAVATEAAGMPSTALSTAAAAAAGGSAANGSSAWGPNDGTVTKYGPWQPFMAPLLVNERVTSADHFQDTRHIEFSLEGAGLEYEPGDLLTILPRTPAADVQAALVRLGLHGDSWVRIEGAESHPSSQNAMPPSNTTRAVCEATVRAVVQGVLDLSGASPRRYMFQVLSHFTDNKLQRERLQYFATAEGREDLYRYNQRERRSLLEVLQDFPAAAFPLEWLLESAPLLSPRQFSIASSPLAHPGRAAILMAVVRWTTPTKRIRQGLLSNWLAGLKPGCNGGLNDTGSGITNGAVAAAVAACNGDANCSGSKDSVTSLQQQQQRRTVLVRVPVWIDNGALRLPPSHATPLLLIGPGTGVAPFRSFLWQRAAIWQQQLLTKQQHAISQYALHQQPEHQQQQQQQDQAGTVADSSCLFFGCRSPTADFYYRQEWLQIMQLKALHRQHGLVVAFSRHKQQPSQQQLLDLLQQAQQHSSSSNYSHGSPGTGSASNGHVPLSVVLTAAAAAATVSPSSRTYVTHKLQEHGAMVWQLLAKQGAWVYVSGSAEKMPANVVTVLEDIVVEHGGLFAGEAAQFVRQLEIAGRYHVEAWN